MNDTSAVTDQEQDAARCPIPDWALRSLAILLPLLAAAAITWLLLR